MSGVVTRRWSDDQGTVWFAVGGVEAECAVAAERLLMDYRRFGSEWRRGYPGDAPYLDRAWENFTECIELVLRQAARLEPVPWREALRELCRRTGGESTSGDSGSRRRGEPLEPGATTDANAEQLKKATTTDRNAELSERRGSTDRSSASAGDRPVRWWLTGSAALAVRGAPIEPGDLDLVCDAADAIALGEVFSDALIEPVMPSSANWLSELWGRAFCGARIEWIGGVKTFVDEPEPCDFGPEAARRLETVRFEDWQIDVPPLELQRAVNQRRGLRNRVAMIDALTG